MGTASPITDFKAIEDDMETAAKRSEKWEEMVQMDLEREREKEERRKKRQQMIAEGKTPLVTYEQLIEMKEQKIKEQEKILEPPKSALLYGHSSLQEPQGLATNLPNDTAEFEIKLNAPQRHHENETSPYRKQIMGEGEEPVKSSPLARGCSNVYDMSFEDDDMDGISELDARGTIGSIAEALGDDVKYL